MTKQEIDPKQIKLITSRFVQLSEARLNRMLSGFSFSQSDYIKLLPFLFHVNHPLLPGYVDKSTPCGIPNYYPTALEKKILKTVSRSYKYQSRAYLKYDVVGLYLMGSTGTLAQSVRSDLDLWICVTEHFDKPQLTKLQKKAGLIGEWLAGVGVELNCFVVHKDDFAQRASKSLSKESCGDTQNYLLLDEFYRTAIWLCGRMPLWWLVPPGEDHSQYSKRLLTNKHVDFADWLDFGEVSEIPASEYFSAALWQMYKAIESPYKSSVKLLILEIYARHFPQTGLLSANYKQLIYDGEDELKKLDPYMMILEYAEDFLKKQPQRLEFLRRAFYLKAGSKIQLNKQNKKNWRYQQLRELVMHWGWKQSRLDYLNDRLNWKVDAVIKERQDLVRELTHSYHFLSNFARVQGVRDQVSQNELASLGRKLYAVFERRASKIDRVNTGIAKDITEAAITIHQKAENEWVLYLGLITQKQLAIRPSAHTANCFFDILAWCVCNHVVTRKTNYKVYAKSSYFDHELAQGIVKDLFSMVDLQKESYLDDDTFQSPAKLIKLGIYLNTQQDPLTKEKKMDVYSIGGNSDFFNWGESQVNMVEQFNTFCINSWGEYSSKQYNGVFSWIDFFVDNRAIINDDNMIFFCRGLPSTAKVQERITGLLGQWNRLILNSERKSKFYSFLMSMGGGFLKLDFTRNRLQFKNFKQTKRFLMALSERPKNDINYVLDDNLIISPAIKKIINKPVASEKNCYLIQHAGERYDIIIKEPSGHLFYHQQQGIYLQNLISHYQQFFDSIDRRSGFLQPESSACQFWHLDESLSNDPGRFKRLKLSERTISEDYWLVQAIATTDSEGKTCFDLYCGETQYCYRDYGELVFRKLAQFVLKKRKSKQRYPIFITDIDLSLVQQEPTTIEYLQYKRVLEQKLQRALTQITK
ncbi:class I adenylate cyclase [Aliikangiella coralliicola]|uniref:Class I adenylate cyclase n=1 Tax=Aliikangiella coralliicola TaxID=2592383 RepID=A0A545UGD7_9GAMM|nr:class I adenylate cyclase [Aliikangiella coralliicola]TQV88529.1 class I adenylate cyclase [Aliikangiella coralliicola]